MKRTVLMALLLALVGSPAIALLACGPEDGDGGPMEARSSVKRQTPTVDSKDLKLQVRGSNRFALDLYHQLSQDGDNLFCSPYSASSALAMLYGGARGNTATQMKQGLHFDLPDKQLHAVFNKLDLDLATRGKGAKGADGGAFRLAVSNALWGQLGYGFLPSYLDLLAANYGAGIKLLNFQQDPEAARKTINAWVANKTEQRIKDLMPAGTVTPNTAMVLTNAVYFNAAWATPFEPSMTRPRSFHTSSKTVTADFMSGSMKLGYHQGNNYQAVSMPYDGHEMSMVVLVPDKGAFGKFSKALDLPTIEGALASMSETEVVLGLPKYSFKRKYKLNDALNKLGMGALFTNTDFSGIDGGGGLLQVSSVIHEAFIKVNEKGAEAAGATGISMDAGVAMPPSQVYLTVDRPFVFLIRDNATGTVLFLGHVEDPLS